ncbi:MAG TPA: hypothetical protein VKU80_13545, partial [Planctomycetota bacterium]|nr:hypothetical protein [Planctomycetota bacterium]
GPWQESRTVVAVHVVLLLGLCLIAFPRNRTYLLNEYDGAFYRTVVKLQSEWGSRAPRLSGNPAAALGNSLFCVQTLYSPSHAVGALLGGGEVRAEALYTVLALELFLSVVVLGACLRLDRTCTLGGAWIFVLGSLPFVDRIQWYPLARIAPVLFEFIAAQLLMIAAFARIGKSDLRGTLLAFVGLAAPLVWAVACAPIGLILCVPPLGILFLLLIFAADDRRERHFKLGSLVLLGLLSLPTFAPYFLGCFLYSVPTFFSGELENDRLAFSWISGLFRRGGSMWIFMPFVALSLAGGVRAFLHASGGLLTIALGTLLQFGIFLALGLVIVVGRLAYLGPSPLYFEVYAWPFYSLLIASLLLGGLERLVQPVLRRLGRAGEFLTPMVAIPVVALLASFVIHTPVPRGMPYPPEKTPLVEHLESQLRLRHGAPFAGSVATFSGLSGKTTYRWLEINESDISLAMRTGNDLRAMGLWYFDIPTLHEYNQCMTPAYYLLLSRLLARPEDRQMRSIMLLTRPRPTYLASLGVRYVLTDLVLNHTATTLDRTDSVTGLQLYELAHPNLGDYSPTILSVEPRARRALERLQAADFAFENEAVVERAPGTELVKATQARLTVERDGWVVEAVSPGRSLLLLPLQFSHCLDLEVRSGSDVRLERVNLMQAGVLFSGTLNARIRFASGPFHNAWGRLR